MSSVRDGYRKHGVIILDGFTLSVFFHDDITCNFSSWKKKIFLFCICREALSKDELFTKHYNGEQKRYSNTEICNIIDQLAWKTLKEKFQK